MKVLVLGATGFIGKHVVTVLLAQGYEVYCGVRNVKKAKQIFPTAKYIKCDFENDIHPETWRPRFKDINIIINCIGIFYHPNKETIWKIHYHAPKAIFEAAFATNIKKIIHISALNSERYPTEYAKSKKAAEDYLLNSGVPAIIVKPSLVYGINEGGGMKLLRYLAAVPFFLFIPGDGQQKIQPIYIEDLAQAIVQLVKVKSTTNKILTAVTEKPITIKRALLGWRKWLHKSPTWQYHMPLSLIKIYAKTRDWSANTVINSDAIIMLEKNNIASKEQADEFSQLIGFKPRNFMQGLAAFPSTAADQYENTFYVFEPILRYSLVAIWFISALTSSFFYPKELSYQLLDQVGITPSLQPLYLYGASLLNLLLGLALLFNFKNKLNYLVQLALITLYTVIITVALPELWLEPFGPIAKNIPIIALILFLYEMEGRK